MTFEQADRIHRRALWIAIILVGITTAGVMVLASYGCAPQQQPLPILPVAQATPAPIVIPPDPLLALAPDVKQAIMQNQLDVLHHGTTTLFPYSPDAEPTIRCAILHTTEIRLNDDERILKHGIDIGDSVAWKEADNGVNSVFVKPTLPGIDTNLVVTTDKRSYHFTLVSAHSAKGAMAATREYYPDDTRAAIAARNALIKAADPK